MQRARAEVLVSACCLLGQNVPVRLRLSQGSRLSQESVLTQRGGRSERGEGIDTDEHHSSVGDGGVDDLRQEATISS